VRSPEKNETEPVNRPPSSEPTRQGKHVYIIDDDEPVRMALTRALVRAGYDVHQFDGAQAFLERAVVFRPAVLLIDMQMPGVNGVQLQAHLQADGWTVPVIFITGASTLSQGITAMKQGALDLLVKPFDLDELTNLIEAAFTRDSLQLQTLARQQLCARQLDVLKQRERDAFFCLARGYSYSEMMNEMGISLPTAKQYRAAVMRKMKFGSLAELIVFHDALTAAER
jgi:FixJ family two-component response regulator